MKNTIISTTNLNELRKQIQRLKKEDKEKKAKTNQPIIVQAQNDEFNRKIFENKDVDIILGVETQKTKDYMKQRNSGLNEIHCKLAKQNNIKIAIDLNNLKKQSAKDKAILLARIKQNIILCKRTKTKLIILPKPSKQEAISLFLSLGASTKQAKESIE